MKTYLNKQSAMRAAKAAGYTEHFSTGCSGDHGYGSREYFREPNCRVNEHGWPCNVATVSRVGRAWYVTVPGAV